MKHNFIKECYDKFVTPETREQVENMSLEECGIIDITKLEEKK